MYNIHYNESRYWHDRYWKVESIGTKSTTLIIRKLILLKIENRGNKVNSFNIEYDDGSMV